MKTPTKILLALFLLTTIGIVHCTTGAPQGSSSPTVEREPTKPPPEPRPLPEPRPPVPRPGPTDTGDPPPPQAPQHR